MDSQNDSLQYYGYNHKETFDKSHYIPQMEIILRGIISAYQLILLENYSEVENLEDKITGRLLIDFLEDDNFREKMALQEYRFIPESASYDEDYNQKGYVDIRVIVDHKINGFNTTKADYIIECKRLDGEKSLNKKYITNGISRFVNELYTKYNIHKVSAMLGFIVKKININDNISKINQLAIDEKIEINTLSPITVFKIDDSFEASYFSKHKTISGKDAEIYHLMLDFSSKILSKN